MPQALITASALNLSLPTQKQSLSSDETRWKTGLLTPLSLLLEEGSELRPTETMPRSYRAQDCEELRGVCPSSSQPGRTVESPAELLRNGQMPGSAPESECH